MKLKLPLQPAVLTFIISTVNVPLNWSLYLNTLKAKGRLHFVGAVLDPIALDAFR